MATCPKCGSKIQLSKNSVGESVSCHSCRSTFTVKKTLRESHQLPPQPPRSLDPFDCIDQREIANRPATFDQPTEDDPSYYSVNIGDGYFERVNRERKTASKNAAREIARWVLISVLVIGPFVFLASPENILFQSASAVTFGIDAIVISLAIYFTPTIIAVTSGHRNVVALFAANFFLGWTFLGWVACLVWSLMASQRKA